MRKTLPLLILFLFSFSAIHADDNGSCGDNLTWKFTSSDGTLTISGTGNMTNFDDYRYVPWGSIRYEIKKVVIGDGVTSIGNFAFDMCTSLTSVTIPNSVMSIGMCAFLGCTKLKTVNLTNNVKIIDIKAFDSCYGLTSFTIPNSVTTIGNYAFYECTNLKSVTIGSSVTSIDKFTFSGCKNLQKVTSKIKKPFAIKDNNFSQETYSKATLYVPKGTVALYKKADGWKNFKNIKEEGTTTAIDDVEAENTLNTSNAIYDINGKRLPATSLDELPSGLYIINGKKVVK